MIDVSAADLVACLELRRELPSVEDQGGVVGDVVTYEGSNLDIGYHRVFGGQILGQLVMAAAGAVPDKSVKSLHVVFPREGDAGRPLIFRVTTRHEGRTFASLAIVVTQPPDERVVALATVSMHAPEVGGALDHAAGPPDVGGPELASEQRLDMIPWHIRVVGGVDLADRTVGEPRLDWWMRSDDFDVTAGQRSDQGSALDQALLAYATDLTLIGTALRPVNGLSQADSTVRVATAVTSHTLWFHGRFAMSDWLQVSQEVPVLRGARAFGRGDVFSGDALVASFSQEAMVRLIEA